MARIIGASIDVMKIDKSRIKERKNGAKYYDISIIVNDTVNQYGQDVAIVQGQTKEEREAKADKVYIGNGKTVWSREPVAAPDPDKEETYSDPLNTPSNYNNGSDLPF